VDRDLGILRGLDDAEEGVVAGLTHAGGVLVPVALFEERSGTHRLRPGGPGDLAHGSPPERIAMLAARILANFTKPCPAASRRPGTSPRGPAGPGAAGGATEGPGRPRSGDHRRANRRTG